MIVPEETDGYAEAHTTPPEPLMAELAEETRSTMSAPGMLLSQPDSVTIPSAAYPSCMVSMQSAMRSRDIREYYIPSIPIVSPSLMTGVPNWNGFPPHATISRERMSPSFLMWSLQGVAFVKGHATVTIGLEKSSSEKSTARSMARAAALLAQSAPPGVSASSLMRGINGRSVMGLSEGTFDILPATSSYRAARSTCM